MFSNRNWSKTPFINTFRINLVAMIRIRPSCIYYGASTRSTVLISVSTRTWLIHTTVHQLLRQCLTLSIRQMTTIYGRFSPSGKFGAVKVRLCTDNGLKFLVAVKESSSISVLVWAGRSGSRANSSEQLSNFMPVAFTNFWSPRRSRRVVRNPERCLFCHFCACDCRCHTNTGRWLEKATNMFQAPNHLCCC